MRTNCSPMPKQLSRRDQAAGVGVIVQPPRLTAGLERGEFDPIEALAGLFVSRRAIGANNGRTLVTISHQMRKHLGCMD